MAAISSIIALGGLVGECVHHSPPYTPSTDKLEEGKGEAEQKGVSERDGGYL